MFSAFNWAKQKDVGLFISPFLRRYWKICDIDYIARLTSFKLPLSFLLGRFKKGG